MTVVHWGLSINRWIESWSKFGGAAVKAYKSGIGGGAIKENLE